MRKKSITFIGLNYAPEDTAIGLYSTQWVSFLKQNGFEVNVITAFPYYPQWRIWDAYRDKPRFFEEELDGLRVIRYKQYVPKSPNFLKRILHLIDFTLGSWRNLYRIKDCDLVISVVPFTSSVFLGYIQKRRFKTKLWTHIQDFEFDAAQQTGLGKKRNWLFKPLFALERWLLSKADIKSTISNSMLMKLDEKSNGLNYLMPNWIDEKAINPESASRHPFLNSTKFKILYSGNIGDKQDWDVFLKLCRDLDLENYEIVVVGSGSKSDWLKSQINEMPHVSLYEPVPFEDLSDLLCSADLHILLQKGDVLDTVMPSKVLGMMASARPSLILGHPDSEVKTIIDKSEGGFYFDNYSQDLIRAIENLRINTALGQNMGKQARKYVITQFSKDQILDQMLKQLDALFVE